MGVAGQIGAIHTFGVGEAASLDQCGAEPVPRGEWQRLGIVDDERIVHPDRLLERGDCFGETPLRPLDPTIEDTGQDAKERPGRMKSKHRP